MFLIPGRKIMISFFTLSSFFFYLSLNYAVTLSGQHLGHKPNSLSFTAFEVVGIKTNNLAWFPNKIRHTHICFPVFIPYNFCIL